jgi:hypothetical protein
VNTIRRGLFRLLSVTLRYRIHSAARTVAKLPHFVNLELNGNQISEAGVEAIRSLLHGAGKILGGKRAHCLLP